MKNTHMSNNNNNNNVLIKLHNAIVDNDINQYLELAKENEERMLDALRITNIGYDVGMMSQMLEEYQY
jgi:hypothetical protein